MMMTAFKGSLHTDAGAGVSSKVAIPAVSRAFFKTSSRLGRVSG
jgi:hypothetical protein